MHHKPDDPNWYRPSREELEALWRSSSRPCVSVYLPARRVGPPVAKDSTRLKNLLREAAQRLERRGWSPRESRELLANGLELVRDEQGWSHQEGGLALFFAPGVSRIFRLPLELPELLVVGDGFHLTPLLALLPAGDETFHVLALSQERVRLLVGDRFQVRELEPEEIPHNLRDAVGYDFEQRSLQFHTGTGGPPGAGGGRRRGMFHGHGAGNEAEDELERFLRQVDGGILRLLRVPRPPLVLAAVERVAAAFRKVSRHGRVVRDFVEGNPDRLSAAELHERAWPLTLRELAQPEREARQTFELLRHTQRTAENLGAIVPESEAGRVALLFVEQGEHCWGTYDPLRRRVAAADASGDGREDLVGRAAMECLAHGGKVFVLDHESFPARGPVAAVYRY